MRDYINEVELKPLSEEDALVVARWTMKYAKKLRLWKEGEKQMIWCDQCQRYEEISPELLKDVKKSRVCPMCFRESSGTSTVDIMDHRYVSDGRYGYDVWFKWEKGKLEVMSADQVAYWNHNEYVSGIVHTMSYTLGRTADTRWRKVRKRYGGYMVYLGDFYDLDSLKQKSTDELCWEVMVTSKKSYYNYIGTGLNLKTNQIKFISEGLFTRGMLEYIEAFDLKSKAQVYKYAKYIRENPCSDGLAIKVHLNPAYLDYLWRNKIRLVDYEDYMRGCKQIGRKLDKPKDFKHWHDEVTIAVEVKMNKQNTAMIQERAKGLKHYEKGEVVMKPIESFEECVRIGHTLHNCIRTYAERYARGECDLYYISDKGQIVVAVEVRHGKVKQARSDHNGTMPAKYNKVLEYCFGRERS